MDAAEKIIGLNAVARKYKKHQWPLTCHQPHLFCQGRGRGRRSSKHVNRVVEETEQQSDSDKSDIDDNYAFSVERPTSGSRHKQPIAKVFIQGMRVSMLIDSGSSVNILDEKQWLMMKNRPTLKPSKTLLFAYGSKKPISIIGEFESSIESNKKMTALYTWLRGMHLFSAIKQHPSLDYTM